MSATVDAGVARKSKVRTTRAKATVLPFKPRLACDYRDDCAHAAAILYDLAERARAGELRGAVLALLTASGEYEFHSAGTLARSVEKAHWAASLLQDLKLDKGRV